jgi:hypothetical protein
MLFWLALPHFSAAVAIQTGQTNGQAYCTALLVRKAGCCTHIPGTNPKDLIPVSTSLLIARFMFPILCLYEYLGHLNIVPTRCRLLVIPDPSAIDQMQAALGQTTNEQVMAIAILNFNFTLVKNHRRVVHWTAIQSAKLSSPHSPHLFEATTQPVWSSWSLNNA